MFKQFDLVVVGHYHDRQLIGDRVHYIGSSHQANFGEDEAKGFGIVWSDCTIEYEQTQFPKYVKTYLDAKDKHGLRDILEMVNDEDKDTIYTNKHRVIITGNKDDVEAFDTTALRMAGIEYKKEGIVNKVDDLKEIPPVVHTRATILKCWGQYSKEANLPKTLQVQGLQKLSKIQF